MKIKQTAGRDQLSGLADEFAKVNDDILFGEVWSDDDVISPKTRSIITISVMIGKGLLDSSFTHHLAFAKENGVTREEIGRIITHAGFYAKWQTPGQPSAWPRKSSMTTPSTMADTSAWERKTRPMQNTSPEHPI